MFDFIFIYFEKNYVYGGPGVKKNLNLTGL